MSKILLLMSGGVDSNVAAFLLKQAGHEIIGLTLSLYWNDDNNTCCGVSATCKAKDTCEKLGIEHYALNKRIDFQTRVIEPFIQAHNAGKTPSPCISCNSDIKIGGMIKYANYFGCDKIATGHYARITNNTIITARDNTKDQSYMLSRVDPKIISRLLFPLGDMLKTEIRALAEANSIYAPSDSQDLCFVQNAEKKEFLAERGIVFDAGNVENTNGDVVGKHNGTCNYTIGQRKGLPTSNKTLYVINIDRSKNKIVVGDETELLIKNCIVSDFIWHYTPVSSRIKVKTRYRAQPIWANYEKINDKILITFDDAQKGIAPGQCLAMYEENNNESNKLIGGGWIN